MIEEQSPFPLVQLQDLCTHVVDCPHSTPKWTENGIVVLRSKNIRGGRLNLDERSYTDEEHYRQRSRRAVVTSGDLVITREAPMGEVCMIPDGLKCCLGQRMVLLRPDNAKCDGRYLLYALQSPIVQHQISWSEGTGSTVSNLRIPHLKELRIPLPERDEQEAIASILGSLDDKIEHNRRTAQALEGLARAIFKAWFVDFEPVKAKAAGATSFPSMPQDVFDALPTAFVDTEIGPVPEGWGPGKLGDVLLEYRDSVRPSELEDDTPYIGLEHMPRRSIRLAKWGEVGSVTSNKARFKAGDFLFGKLRPYFHKVGVAPLDGVCSTDIVVMRPKSPEWFAFGLGHVSSDAFVAYTNACSSGTKMPRTNWRDMSNYRIVLPSSRLVRTYDKLVSPFVDSMRHGIFESKKLSELRDYLLPTLILGRNDHDEIMM